MSAKACSTMQRSCHGRGAILARALAALLSHSVARLLVQPVSFPATPVLHSISSRQPVSQHGAIAPRSWSDHATSAARLNFTQLCSSPVAVSLPATPVIHSSSSRNPRSIAQPFRPRVVPLRPVTMRLSSSNPM